MAGVFISYRREDAPGHAGRIFDRVRARFGADVGFMDVNCIVNNNGIHPLDFTSRFGYPTIFIQQ